MIKLASQFKNIHERLYGPQEDELGDNAHPLPFAAMCKQRRTAARVTRAARSSMVT